MKRKRLTSNGEPLFLCIKKADSEESAENLTKLDILHPPYGRDPAAVFAGAGNGDQQTTNSFLMLPSM